MARVNPLTPSEFWDRVSPMVTVDEDGCWRYHGHIQNVGYGRFSGKLVHRISYEYWVGPIPEDKQMDHLCRVRECCNPDHLEVVTARENTLRIPRPETCPKGHNNWGTRSGSSKSKYRSRRCLTCKYAQDKDRKRRKREEAKWLTA